jgi:hypothetical protein
MLSHIFVGELSLISSVIADAASGGVLSLVTPAADWILFQTANRLKT